MKKLQLLLVSVAMLSIFSCSDDDDDTLNISPKIQKKKEKNEYNSIKSRLNGSRESKGKASKKAKFDVSDDDSILNDDNPFQSRPKLMEDSDNSSIKNNEKLVEKQDKREENYQKLLSDMTEKYAVVEDIRNSVDEIQKKVEMLSTEQKV